MVQVTIGWGGQLQGSEANVVQGLVINAVGFIRVLNQLMYGKGGIVRLHNGIRYLSRFNC